MINRKKSFEDILKLINFEFDQGFYGGAVESVIINKDTLGVDIVITFDEYLPPELLTDLKNSLEKNLLEKKFGEKATLTFKFNKKDLPASKVEEYYKYFIDYLCITKRRFAALHTYSTSYENSKITVLVGSDEDRDIVNNLVDTLKKCFERINMEYVNIEIVNSDFIIPISKEIEVSRLASAEDAKRNQVIYDNSLKNLAETEKAKKGIRPKKMTTALSQPSVKISTIPTSEYDLEHYRQQNENTAFVVEGYITKSSIRLLSTGSKLFEGIITDDEDSIIIKTFLNEHNKSQIDYYEKYGNPGNNFKVFGYAKYDTFSRDVVLEIRDVEWKGTHNDIDSNIFDDSLVKRVELHAHTKMTAQDSVLDVDKYVEMAKRFGHKALAITDKFNIQALPELEHLLKKSDIKPIYGLEGLLVDEDKFNIAFNVADINLLDATYVVYDLETTSLSSEYGKIIEISACKVKDGRIVDEFSTFVNPEVEINEKTTNLTSITNDDVRFAPKIDEILPNFKKFIKDTILVAHNASFDNSYLYKNLKDLNLYDGLIPTIDTMRFAMVCFSGNIKKFGLENVTKYFNVELEQHHRAISDARATAEVFIKMLKYALDKGINNYNQINSLINENEAYKYAFPTHICLLAKNRTGLVNLNKIVSQSHTINFYKNPRILKKFLNSHREGLLIGSACCRSNIFEIAMNGSYDALKEAVKFYDYLEVQPLDVYSHLVNNNDKSIDFEHLQMIIKKIIDAGHEENKIVVATGNVHHLLPEDRLFRKILLEVPMVGGGLHELNGLDDIPSQHFRSTNEMLNNFKFLGTDLAYEIVVTNTNKIADMIERFSLFPSQLFAPGDDFMAHRGVPSAKQAVIDLTYETAHRIYGDKLPKYVEDRIEKELKSIIGNNFGSIYYIAYLLVKHSKDDGYVVGSRGSVGSSLVANFMGITEVNSLVPHYVCPKCKFSAFKFNEEQKYLYPQSDQSLMFDSILQQYDTGYDLPVQTCPICGEVLNQNGCDIPFETFLGFKGDKVPDIDLNFSGEYQAKAHAFCREIFGVEHTFRAGTISTIADQTAYGYISGHFERVGVNKRNCEKDRLAPKLVGVKRTTGQHPGGIVVVPENIDINEITPVQYAADSTDNDWQTSHHGYHEFESNLLKLDILGHDDPTMIRHLMDFVERYPEDFPFTKVEEIPLSDKGVLSLFSSVESLGVTPQQIQMQIATTGLPEFGTTLAKDMLSEIKPKTISDLIKISGLSHGTNVWNGNERDFFLGNKKGYSPVPFKELIGCRDDIMVYLMNKGLEPSDSFKIMEEVRKADRTLSKDHEVTMLEHDVPGWYIDACKGIQYMFPKAHATAYVIMALRIGWFKLYRPLYYYAGFFSKRADEFEIEAMVAGYDAIVAKINEIKPVDRSSKKDVKPKDAKKYTSLLVALEMVSRGYKFVQIDILKSDWQDFIIEGDSLIIPFIAMDSLGVAIAKSVVDARNEAMFTSKADVIRRTRLNTTLVEKLTRLGVFKDLPEDDQIGLFKNI